MKLAEALILRADYQKRMEQLRNRLSVAAKVQEGETPPHDPAAMMREYEQVSHDLAELVRKVNAANANEKFDGQRSLADALAERDELARHQAMLRGVINSASESQPRYSKSEIRMVATVDIGKLQKQADELAKQHRELDTKIQEKNWQLNI
jgi:hypothetical protein